MQPTSFLVPCSITLPFHFSPFPVACFRGPESWTSPVSRVRVSVHVDVHVSVRHVTLAVEAASGGMGGGGRPSGWHRTTLWYERHARQSRGLAKAPVRGAELGRVIGEEVGGPSRREERMWGQVWAQRRKCCQDGR